jgi:hypothetical protein
MAQRGDYARRCLESKWTGHMEEVRGAGGEAIRLDSALDTRRILETVYGTRRANEPMSHQRWL